MSVLAVNVDSVGPAIQLALAPVFLLTGIAALLGVMTGRLARIIDRGRQLTESPGGASAAMDERVAREFEMLDRSHLLAGSAITVCTFAALLVCTVIAGLFIEALL